MVDKIASLSVLAIAKAKDCINRAYEVPLSEGLRYEQCAPFSPIETSHSLSPSALCINSEHRACSVS